MMMGSAYENRADTAGGRTPEMIVKVAGDAFDHDCRKGT